ncbi:MAG TPA: hypothetical protein VNE39_28635 [Planctomycetota bacterium]|nr:hypothetical protein [Planctomycetota bacterium]
MSETLDLTTSAPATAAPGPVPAGPPEPTEQGGSRVLGRLLEMADTLRAHGKLHQSIELYFTLVEAHAGTDQAAQAFDRLVQTAEGYDEAGERHQARSLYERLLLSES